MKKLCLQLSDAQGSTRNFEINAISGKRYIFGRTEGDFQFADPKASRKHFAVEYDGAQWWIEDLQSTNKTWLKGNPLLRQTVQDKMQFIVGTTTFNISLPVSKDATAVDILPSPEKNLFEKGRDLLAKNLNLASEQIKASIDKSHDPTSPLSHPENLVRHSYKVNLKNGDLSESYGLLMKTLPYAMLRFGILMAVTIVTTIWFAVAFIGAGILAKYIAPVVGQVWLLLSVGIFGFGWKFFVHYAVYLIKCGHIAVLTELITTGTINNGSDSMFSYGKKKVTEHFGQVNSLLVLDGMIKKIVGVFNRGVDFLTSFIPIKGVREGASIVKLITRKATTYIDEAIFSYNLARKDQNTWRSSRDGIIYYCQNAKPMLFVAIKGLFMEAFLTVGIVLAGVIIGRILASPFPINWNGVPAAFYLAFWAVSAFNFRTAFIKPLFLIMVIAKYHVMIKNQPINEEWDARLCEASKVFQELTQKAADFTQPGTATTNKAA